MTDAAADTRPARLAGEVWRILLVLYASALVGVVYAYALAWFGLEPRFDRAAWRVFHWWTLGASAFALGVGVPLTYWLARPLKIAAERIDSGEDARAPDFDLARRRAVNLPAILGLCIFLLWVVPTASLPFFSSISAAGPDAKSVAIACVGISFIALVHATFIVYLAEWRVRRRFMPALLPEGNISSIEGVHPVSVTAKLTLLFTTTGIFPLFVFTVLHAAGTASSESVAFLAGTSLVLGLAQAGLIAASVTRPLGALHSNMERVRRGDLSARASVDTGDRFGRVNEGFNEMVRDLEFAEFVKETFGRYVTRQVRDEILAGNVHLGGERREVTLLFCDMRNFTSMCEELRAEEVVGLLNRHLDEMVDELVAHGATIDKFVGDAILAIFGAPVAEDDHPQRAVRAGIQMLERLDRLNAERDAAGEPSIDIGIGIHTGEVIAGNIGSAKKMEYTVIGDTVNTASRIEQLNKQLGTRLLISAETQARVSSEITAMQHGPLELRGKRGMVFVYEVTEIATVARKRIFTPVTL